MARFNPYEQYNDVSFSTADPASLVVTTYNAAIRSMKEAAKAIREGDVESRTRNFDLAFNLISELRKSLNPEVDDKLVNRLDALYEYFTRELLIANAGSDAKRLQPVITMMTDLRDTWNEARKQQVTA